MPVQVALPGQEVIGIIPPGELAELGIVQAVPIVAAPWFDNRQTCRLAHAYLAGAIEGRFEEYHTCSSYAAGVCRGTGGAGLVCLFHEADQAPAWAQARQWRRLRLADGSTALTPRPA